VRIYGSGFDATASNNTVTFGGASATADSAKPNVLYATVPSGVSGRVSVEVTTGGTTVTATNRFSALRGGTDVFSALDLNIEKGEVIRKGDYDGDGDLDLALLEGGSELQIYRNEGDTFTNIEAGLGNHVTMEWGDFDTDGDLDLVATGEGFSLSTVLYENKGGGAFEAVSTGLTDVNNSEADWGDFDGDGDLDLIIAGEDTDGNITTTLYENEGGGTFTPKSTNIEEIRQGDLEWGDFDGDGDLDLVVTGYTPGEYSGTDTITEIYRNDGLGTFTLAKSLSTDLIGNSVDWGDFDADGDLDLVLSAEEEVGFDFVPATNIYKNEGSGTFSEI
jgi:hypothetical protein